MANADMRVLRTPVYFFRRLDGGLIFEFVFESDAIAERIRPDAERFVSYFYSLEKSAYVHGRRDAKDFITVSCIGTERLL